ncbi:MAG: universal stress protein [Bacteroidales bacterium]|jgi:nucleotide-binding universal stress UspA family protein|nr:universal stress protein [Bacteroidales bacterium]
MKTVVIQVLIKDDNHNMQEDQENNVIVVTWDFTQVSEYALAHAVKLAKIMNYEIKLLHIVKAGVSDYVIEKAEEQLLIVSKKTYGETGVVCSVVIQKGNLFSAISDYASQTNTQLVVMGTHGIKGAQKLFGSKALKVLTGSNAPFIVVQSMPDQNAKIASVVFPIDFKSENKEKVQWAIYAGRNFSSKVYLFKSPVMDSDLQKKVNANLNFAIRFLKQNDIEYEIFTASKSSDFAGETIRFAEQMKADLIIVTTTKDITQFDYIFGADEQTIIANSAQIPVMCMNPMLRYARVGQFMYG